MTFPDFSISHNSPLLHFYSKKRYKIAEKFVTLQPTTFKHKNKKPHRGPVHL